MTSKQAYNKIKEMDFKIKSYNPFHFKYLDHIDSIIMARQASYEEWLSNEMAKALEPNMFLRAYGNDSCKQDVASKLKILGFEIRQYTYKSDIELWRGEELISIYNKSEDKPLKEINWNGEFRF